MLTALLNVFYRIASWKTLLLAIVLYIPFPGYFLKNFEARINAFAGEPIGPVDLLVGYDPPKISRMIGAYGPEGRAMYAQGTMTVDLIYPFVYTFLFCIILSLLFRNKQYTPFRAVNIIPVGILFFDLLENACLVYLLKGYPETAMAVVSLCSILTNLKWAVTALAAGIALYGLVQLALRGRQQRIEQV